MYKGVLLFQNRATKIVPFFRTTKFFYKKMLFFFIF